MWQEKEYERVEEIRGNRYCDVFSTELSSYEKKRAEY